VSPVLTGSTWGALGVPIEEGEHLLLYTDGIWESLADEDGRAEERFTTAIGRNCEGGAALLDALLADVDQQSADQAQADDLTLMTASLLPPRP
jgi:serine phosphatase RsbU (regulator of sigma subunit)